MQPKLTHVEPRSAILGDKLLGIGANLYPERACGSKRVKIEEATPLQKRLLILIVLPQSSGPLWLGRTSRFARRIQCRFDGFEDQD